MNASSHDSPPDDASPAEALGGVWRLLDELPQTPASQSLAATTVERAAIRSPASATLSNWRALLDRIVASPFGVAAIVGGALLVGFVAGRLTQPSLSRRAINEARQRAAEAEWRARAAWWERRESGRPMPPGWPERNPRLRPNLPFRPAAPPPPAETPAPPN